MVFLGFGLNIPFYLLKSVVTGEDPGFNATKMHQQKPNYRPFRQHLRSRWSLTRGRGRDGYRTQMYATLAGTHLCDCNTLTENL